uniref:Uncharacterized protein n=1 Tax=Odontella aurita TaxID=265563 RepID=A0A7S4MBD1_9STRA
MSTAVLRRESSIHAVGGGWGSDEDDDDITVYRVHEKGAHPTRPGPGGGADENGASGGLPKEKGDGEGEGASNNRFPGRSRNPSLPHMASEWDARGRFRSRSDSPAEKGQYCWARGDDLRFGDAVYERFSGRLNVVKPRPPSPPPVARRMSATKVWNSVENLLSEELIEGRGDVNDNWLNRLDDEHALPSQRRILDDDDWLDLVRFP